MIHPVQAAVIGCGPAGSACGITMQKRGIPNCVIDRAIFPRDKACGGGVTNKALRELEAIVGREWAQRRGLFCDVVSRVAIYDRNTLLCEADCDTPFHIVDRARFDGALAKAYRELDGTLLEGQKRYEIDYDARRIALENGDVVQYEYLVFADGALSRAHSDFSVKQKSMSFCMEVFLPRDQMPTDAMELHIGIVPNGYLWVFPHGDEVCVGLGTLHRAGEAFPYRETLESYLRQRGVCTDAVAFRGAFVPYGKLTPQNRFPKNVLLAGDCGGFVDPLYGEGLYMALRSGRLAGEAMSAEAPKRAYLEGMRPCMRMIRSGRWFQRLLFSKPVQSRLADKVAERSGFLKYYCDQQLSEYRYSHMDARILSDYMRIKAQRSDRQDRAGGGD